jgi:stage V sporulation protein G
MTTATEKKIAKEELAKRNGIDVTAVQVFLLKERMGKTYAIARVVLNDQMQLTGLRIVDGANGLFVSYPNDPGYKGEDYRSLFYPVTRELRDHIESLVLSKYKELMDEKAEEDKK